jgi:hypothetical protein
MPRDADRLATLPRLSALGAFPREGRAMQNYDVTLAWSSLLLLAIGLVMVYSASIAMAEASAHTGYRPWYFLARHASFVVVGLFAALVAFQVPLKAWQRAAPYLFILGATLLVAFVPLVKQVNGSAAAVALRQLQPSEPDEAFGRPQSMRGGRFFFTSSRFWANLVKRSRAKLAVIASKRCTQN